MRRDEQRGHPYQSMVQPSILKKLVSRCQASNQVGIRRDAPRQIEAKDEPLPKHVPGQVSGRLRLHGGHTERGVRGCPSAALGASETPRRSQKCRWYPHRGCRVQVLNSTDDAHRPSSRRSQLGDRQAREGHKRVLTSRVADET
jgi:hypothetical protein